MTKHKQHKPQPQTTNRSDREGGRSSRGRTGKLVAGGTAAALAGAALFNVARARKAERDTPPEGRFIEIDGVQLHYTETGEGPPLVLLHGNGAMIQDWELSGVLPRVAGRYRVIAFDRPGFGYTERPRNRLWTPTAQAELIFKALGELGIERPIVVGHSWSTLVALAMALDHPEDVAALVLLSGYYFRSARPDAALLSPPAIPVVGDLMRFTVSPLLARLMSPVMIKTLFSPAPVPERFAEWPLELAMRPSQIRAVAADTGLMIPAAYMISQRYEELRLPVMILGAAGDKIVHFDEQSELLHAKVAHSELTTVAGAGHMLHYQDPAAVAAAIDRARDLSRKAGAPSLSLAGETAEAA